jgi:hypothetical protein
MGLGRENEHSIPALVEKEIEEKEEKEEAGQVVGLANILDDTLIRFCEAVVHPFGNAAIGATLPDRYQELVIPLTDRLELDITPDLFNFPGLGADWTSDSGVQLSGVFFWFQPRSVGAGLIELTGTVPPYITNPPALTVDDTLSASNFATILNQYNLCFTGIWEVSYSGQAPVTYGFYQGDTVAAIANTYVAIQYSRFDNIVNNCDKMRILGAGLKIWSEQAPINTGGYSVGGWITMEDIYTAMQLDSALAAVNPGSLKAIQPKIKFACRTPGVKGSTVRYSPLQTAEQSEPEYPTIPSRMFYVGDTEIPSNPFYIQPNVNVDLGIHDVITPGSFVPCIFWQFNTTDESTQASAIYTLKVMSMVHSEGTPTGESPFMSNKSNYDPSVEHVKMMLENPEVFPAATKGHSFKSFMSKAKRVVGRVSKFASKSVKLMNLVDKMLNL